jgi:hypothetical protein
MDTDWCHSSVTEGLGKSAPVRFVRESDRGLGETASRNTLLASPRPLARIMGKELTNEGGSCNYRQHPEMILS